MNPSFARSIGLKFDSVPVIVSLDSTGNQEILTPMEQTREGFTNIIFEHFKIEKKDYVFAKNSKLKRHVGKLSNTYFFQIILQQ